MRYAGVSLVFVPLGQVLTQIFHFTTNWSDAGCIAATAVILTVPNFYANKIRVWRVTSHDRQRTQILVFWVAAMLGTGFAMGLAALAETATRDSSGLWQSLSLFAAQLTGYGVVWVARFLFLDRWLFKATQHGAEPTADDTMEMHRELPI